ncbi:AraC family transcriptional regulator [Halobacteriovorax sp. RT-2-6]|uniref:AraC family transcriptional regulator n=1 Tax=unclassified Halobacteriovorax TaxID=2639665 RepID=UPI00399B5EF9
MSNEYNDRIALICKYIADNINEDLNLEKLSEVSGLSKYHFHRVFTAKLNISLYSFIQLTRLKRASYQLVFNKEMKIIDIAFDANFDSPEAFSRSFKKVFNVTPSQFRSAPNWEKWHEKYQFIIPTGDNHMEIKIINLEEMKVAVLEHRASPTTLNNSVEKFKNWRIQSKQSPINKARTFGIVYNDPNNTKPEDFAFDICGELFEDLKQNKDGVIEKTIPAGRCAVARHFGSPDNIEGKIYELYGKWLPTSGEELRDFPLFFHYHNFFPEVPENELITDIYLPLI